jgi:spore maturation protein CgeB
MVRAGHSPSVRLFEAAACGTPILSDRWEGLDAILTPGAEIALAEAPEDVLAALGWPEERRRAMADAARKRVLAEHTAAHRAGELESHLRAAIAGRQGRPPGRAAPARPADAQVST